MPEASSPPIDFFSSLLARLSSHVEMETLVRQAGSFQRPHGVRSGTALLWLAWLGVPAATPHQRDFRRRPTFLGGARIIP